MTDTTIHPVRQTRPRDRELVPRVLVRAVAALMLTVLALVTMAVVTDRPLEAVPPKGDAGIRHDVLLSGDLAGRAEVRTLDGRLVADLSPEAGGFVAGVHRVIIRERTKHRVSLDGPITLIGSEAGRVSIHDPSTGWSADLMGFGADNARAFAKLLAQLEEANNGMADKGN